MSLKVRLQSLNKDFVEENIKLTVKQLEDAGMQYLFIHNQFLNVIDKKHNVIFEYFYSIILQKELEIRNKPICIIGHFHILMFEEMIFEVPRGK